MTMNTKNLLLGTLVGGLVYFFLGFLFYAVIFNDFFVAQMGTATGVQKTEMEWWPLVLGNFSIAFLLTYIFTRWADISTMVPGIKAGALVGFLMALGWDMTTYDTTNIIRLPGALADVLIVTVMMAIVGGVIGLVIRKA
jgi:hypothetical protein